MNRRRFLQLGGLAGLALMAPVVTNVKKSHADEGLHGGPYWITIHAGGGWDPTMFCDPKGGDAESRESVNRSFTPDQIGSAGPFKYAPTAWMVDADGGQKEVYSCKRFFEAHAGRVMIINGLDTMTNNHDTGTRVVWSGATTEGQPAFAALVAGAVMAKTQVPMAFMSNGGYDATGGLVPLTRAGNIDSLRRIAYPEIANPDKIGTKDEAHFVSDETAQRILQRQNERLMAHRDKQKLPLLKKSADALYLSRSGNAALTALATKLNNIELVKINSDNPDPILKDLNGLGGLGGLESLVQQAQLAMLAFSAGVAVSASIDLGGFDSHDDSDRRQTEQMTKLLRTVDYIFKKADEMGLGDRLYVLVGSDFGRTPFYNEGNGKDHWNTTSMMLAGPGIPGGRLIGGTDEKFKPMRVNAADPTQVVGGDDEANPRIEPKHVHRALRKLAGIDADPVTAQFGLPGDDMPIFG